jgi:hypothetical protein
MRAFLDKTKLCSDDVFGTEATAFIEAPGSSPETKKLIGVQSSRSSFDDSSTSRLILFERHAVEQMHLHKSFRNALDRLETDADPYYEYIDATTSRHKPDKSIEATMRRIGLRYDEPNQDKLRVSIDGLVTRNVTVLNSTHEELALIPSAESKVTAMLAEQANVCIRGLAYHGRKSVYPYTPAILSMPFAKIPRDITPDQRSEFIQSIKNYLPIVVQLGSLSINQIRHYRVNS